MTYELCIAPEICYGPWARASSMEYFVPICIQVSWRACGGHQGRGVDDGPLPTAKQWCNNGLALAVISDSA
jgi:peptide methionine sulfoxide reductase MsrB